MANQEENTLSHGAFFPPPPPFYKNFTNANLARLKDLQQNIFTSSGAESTQTPPPILDLPPELRTLIPPIPPTSGQFKTFGTTQTTAPPTSTTSPSGPDPTEPFEPLYPQPPSNPPIHLRHLTRSLLLNFLELLGLLSQNPALWRDKIHHLHVHLVNAHQLINDYRPHQARETLIRLMEEQVERKRKEVEGVRGMRVKIEGVLAGLGEEGREVAGEERELKETAKGDGRVLVQREMWRVLEEELGVEG